MSFPLGQLLTSIKKAMKVNLRTAADDELFSAEHPGAVTVSGSFASLKTAPVTGVKTVTATAAELFAGASRKAERVWLILKNEDPILRFRVIPSTGTQQNGFPVEPGAVIEIPCDPATAVPVYAISEGASLKVAVMEI